MAKIFLCLIFALFSVQCLGLKNPLHRQHDIPQPAYIPPQRLCGCDELNKCLDDQAGKESHLLASCRKECGARVFLDSTSKKVSGCYEAFDKKRSDSDSQSRQCVESMGVRQCVSDQHHETPATFTINTTEYLQSGNKRCNGQKKLVLPESVNQLNTCIRTCVKNLGVVQFNPDGTIAKPATQTKTGKNKENGEQKKEKENGGRSGTAAICATMLNCQLSPIDKKLDKQARQLCKFQPQESQEDTEMTLCTCLESALGQNLHCTEQLSTESCASTSTQCPHAKKEGAKNDEV